MTASGCAAVVELSAHRAVIFILLALLGVDDMNDEAQTVLANMLQRALDGVDSAVEFSQAQIPDVVEQLLMWHFVESLFYFVAGLLFLTSVPVLFKAVERRGIQRKQSAMDDYEKGARWTRFGGSSDTTSHEYDFVIRVSGNAKYISLLLAIPGLSMLFSNLTWLKIWIAPKLYLLEYGASLIK